MRKRINDEPWFVGKDVAEALGFKRTADALSAHVDDEDKNFVKVGEIPTLNVATSLSVDFPDELCYTIFKQKK